MATAPQDTSCLLLIGETIPDLADVRVGSFCSAIEMRDGNFTDDAMQLEHGAWMIWNDCSDWFFINAYEPLGWFPLPSRDSASGMKLAKTADVVIDA